MRILSLQVDSTLEAVTHIMRYIKHSSNYGLEFGRSGNVDLKYFRDSEWGGDTATRNRHPATSFKWLVVLLLGVRRNKLCLPCHQ
jgi:hypothetical protein